MLPSSLPKANAGSDQIVMEGELVTLDGTSSSDPDGDPITYLWTQTTGPHVTLSNANIPDPTFLAPEVDEQTALIFRLTISDGVLTDSVPVTFTISPTIDFYITSYPGFTNIQRGQTVKSTIAVTLKSLDPQVVDLKVDLSCSGFPSSQGSCNISPSTVIPTLTSPSTATLTISTRNTTLLGQYDVVITGNVQAITRSTTFVIDIEPIVPPPNKSPVAIISPGGQIALDRPITFSASNSYDEDGKIVSYLWDFGDSSGLISKDTNEPLTYIYSEPGKHFVVLTVIDNLGARNNTSFNVDIPPPSDPLKPPLTTTIIGGVVAVIGGIATTIMVLKVKKRKRK